LLQAACNYKQQAARRFSLIYDTRVVKGGTDSLAARQIGEAWRVWMAALEKKNGKWVAPYTPIACERE
jgi:hypothetical protein